jgi:ketosteroid isomerase-like protein
MSSEAAAREWLRGLEAAVAARDFAAGRRLFADDAVAFGTWARAVSGLENIEREQWRNVWPRVRRFRFDDKPMIGGTSDSAWVAATWSSEATGPDGRTFERPGRATIVLARQGDRWVAVHTHLSLLPSQAETAHGRL